MIFPATDTLLPPQKNLGRTPHPPKIFKKNNIRSNSKILTLPQTERSYSLQAHTKNSCMAEAITEI